MAMATETLAAPFVERRKPREKTRPADRGWTLFLLIVTLLMVAGYFVLRNHPYQAGDKIGYNLGLAGGLMMLSLLVYPLRKRAHFMRNWLPLPWWFKWHMIFGVIGPALIVLHTTFHVGAFNSGTALFFTLLVSGSGIFGRFFYTKVHWGLYGRQLTLKQLQDDLQGQGDIKSTLAFAPAIQQRLVEFREDALKPSRGGLARMWNFLILGTRADLLYNQLERELEDVMYADAQKKRWNKAQMRLLDQLYDENRTFIRSYLIAIRDLAQFESYERLLSIWNFFHVPPVYMLAFSAGWHVIAVHLY